MSHRRDELKNGQGYGAYHSLLGCITSYAMAVITPEKLHELLDALGDQLAFAGYPTHIVVIGGSGLAGIGAITRATRDIDIVALHRDGQLVSAEPLPDPVIAAARIVARDFRLAPGWLNSAPTSLLDAADGLPAGFANRMITRAFGSALTVSFASRIDQVHLKLYAAADRGEARDFDDLHALAPTADELRSAASWARSHNMPGPFDEDIRRTLRTFGVEDEGRSA
jgi:hypothetical protein